MFLTRLTSEILSMYLFAHVSVEPDGVSHGHDCQATRVQQTHNPLVLHWDRAFVVLACQVFRLSPRPQTF